MQKQFADIGERLRRIRLMMGFTTQVAFARVLGVETARYAHWERGYARMKFEEAILICTKTGVTLDYIIRGEVGGLSSVLKRELENQVPLGGCP